MRSLRRLLLPACACLASFAAHAGGFWLPVGDERLRDDVTLLVDEGVIRVPTGAWPIPVQDLRAALSRTSIDLIHNSALQFALLRVQQRVAADDSAGSWRIREIGATAGEPGLLRDYATLGRENGELRAVGGTSNDRWSVNVAATGVLSPEDGQSLRLDGTDLSLRWGNWLFSANALDRWWGPGHEGSLILSNNARPMMQLSLDRVRSTRSSVPILSWIGPWRFTGFIAAMEHERADVDHPLFLGMRFSFKPAQILEFGLSRSAQFCGSGRPCDLETFGRVLIGQDNQGIRGLDPANEPGNQMAGADFRIVSPIRSVPLAFYGQLIGEDGSSTGIPERYLGLFGLEGWWLRDSGTAVRLTLEYSNTSCKWYERGGNIDCAYRQGIFNAGYRYRGRTIGHATDSDSETVSADLRLLQSNGEEWGIKVKRARLDRFGPPDAFNPVTYGPGEHQSVELRWQGRIWNENLGVQLGFEDEKLGVRRDGGAFGFVSWRRSL